MELALRTSGAYGLTQVTPPAEEPVSREQAKKQCEVARSIVAHDAHFDHLIRAARRHVETLTSRQLCTATWELRLDAFPSGCRPIRVPLAPLQSVVHVKFVDAGGTLQTLAASSYKVVTSREPGEIHPAYGLTWPVPRSEPDAVQLQFVAGYGTPADVPETAKQAILLLVQHWFENRGAVVTGSISKELEFSLRGLLQSLAYGDEFLLVGE